MERTYEAQHNYSIHNNILPCVFEVPDNLKETKPEAYTPQLLGLGPYHHFGQQVQHMEMEKRTGVLLYLKLVDFKDFSVIAEKCPDDFELMIRTCYDRYLDLDKETLAWVVLVDSVFLWMLMGQGSSAPVSNQALCAELFMLENQIPVVLILESFKLIFSFIGGIQNLNEDTYELVLLYSYESFCVIFSPLKLTENAEVCCDKNKHLLHHMYHKIVKSKKDNNNNSSNNNDNNNPEERHQDNNNNWVRGFARAVRGNAREAASQGREILMEAIEVVNSSLYAKSAGINVPGNVDTVSNLLRNIQKVLDLHHKKLTFGDDQIDIPSASRLKAILKIKFTTCWGIGDISLKGKILYLPVMTLQPSSEVVLRNLAAYEEIAKMRPTPIRAYMELTARLVKSVKDVVLLRGAGIIEGEQLPNEEIVRMCNGLKNFDKKPDEESNNNVQSTVKDVKDQFGKAACRLIMKGFAGCVKFFKPLFPVLVVLFLAFQSFCEIYGCRTRRSSYGGAALHGELDANARLMQKVYRY